MDYCGYSVLPMAIQYDIVMAVKAINEPKLQLTNVDTEHQDFECDINSFRYKFIIYIIIETKIRLYSSKHSINPLGLQS